MATDKEGQLKRIDYGDRVYFDSVTGIAGTTYPIGTASMPSSVIAAVITLCAALNLSRIDVHGILQLGAAMEHYTFLGHCHESIADVLDLNGQDVDDSRFDNCLITGAQGGAGFATYDKCILYNMTGFRGMAENCSLYTPLAVSVGVSDLDRCTSLHGVLTVTVGAPARLSFKEFSGGMILTLQTGGTAFVRGISGYLEVDEMTGGTLDIYAHGTDIQINADCTAGTINIYGVARVTGAGGGVAINDYTINMVPAVDAATDVQARDVIGNKADTALQAATATASLMRYIKGLLLGGSRELFTMDFWSDPVEEKAVTDAQVTAAVGAAVVIAGLPAGATIVRAIVMMKFRMVENTNAAENSLDCTAVQPIQVNDSAPTGWVTAIDFVDEQFKIAATTREGGDVLIGDNDVSARVDGEDTYDFQWLNALAHLANIQFNDIQMGIRIWYSV